MIQGKYDISEYIEKRSKQKHRNKEIDKFQR